MIAFFKICVFKKKMNTIKKNHMKALKQATKGNKTAKGGHCSGPAVAAGVSGRCGQSV